MRGVLRASILLIVLLVWTGTAAAEVADDMCVGCTCTIKTKVEVCEGGADPATTSSGGIGGDLFVCWLEGEVPGDSADICIGYCKSLTPPPPGPCMAGTRLVPVYVAEQRGGGCIPGCPADEAGHCDDGINNDAFLNEETDCRDPACADDPACMVMAPAASESGMVVVLLALFLLGLVPLLRVSRSS